jgi:hypothetical protein
VTEPEEVSCHKVRTSTAGMVAVRIYPDQQLSWRLYDDQGQQICAEYESGRACELPAAGAYTLLVQNEDFGGERTFQVAVAALFRNAGCSPNTGTSWDLPALLVHQTSAVQTNCQLFRGNAGDRIMTYAAPTVYNEVAWWLADSTGAVVCPELSEEDGCVLPANGTYRVVSYLRTWDGESDDLTYRLQVRRLSNPAGCPAVTPGAYGAAPAGAPGGIRCRILDIPAAGTYLLKAVDAENYETYGQVYDAAGLRMSACGTLMCTFTAPGRYTMVLDGSVPTSVIDNDFRYAVVLLHGAPSGCPTVSDMGYAGAPHRGEFAAAGEHDCLTLSSPAGARIVELLPGDATGAGAPWTTVVDATGAYVCDSSWALRQYSCELTGTAPFYAVLDPDEGHPTGTYALAYARVDGPPACPVLPRGAAGATVATGADRFAACFSIAADQHAAREIFTYRRTSGDGDARMSIFDRTGIRYCGPTGASVDRTFTCPLPDGPATVILEADAVNATYQVTHRDAATPDP